MRDAEPVPLEDLYDMTNGEEPPPLAADSFGEEGSQWPALVFQSNQDHLRDRAAKREDQRAGVMLSREKEARRRRRNYDAKMERINLFKQRKEQLREKVKMTNLRHQKEREAVRVRVDELRRHDKMFELGALPSLHALRSSVSAQSRGHGSRRGGARGVRPLRRNTAGHGPADAGLEGSSFYDFGMSDDDAPIYSHVAGSKAFRSAVSLSSSTKTDAETSESLSFTEVVAPPPDPSSVEAFSRILAASGVVGSRAEPPGVGKFSMSVPRAHTAFPLRSSSLLSRQSFSMVSPALLRRSPSGGLGGPGGSQSSPAFSVGSALSESLGSIAFPSLALGGSSVLSGASSILSEASDPQLRSRMQPRPRRIKQRPWTQADSRLQSVLHPAKSGFLSGSEVRKEAAQRTRFATLGHLAPRKNTFPMPSTFWEKTFAQHSGQFASQSSIHLSAAHRAEGMYHIAELRKRQMANMKRLLKVERDAEVERQARAMAERNSQRRARLHKDAVVARQRSRDRVLRIAREHELALASRMAALGLIR